jgi:hypothetical protein
MTLIKKVVLSLLIISPSTFSAHDAKIVRLAPPLISRETISEEVYCDRPMREGKFNISLEQSLNKTIIHCYGHGGSGWTTLFGSVNKALNLFAATHPSKDTPIRIIGSGCMGLTTAIELKRRGYTVAGITTKNLYDMPSWRAAGYFALVSVKTSPEEQKNLNDIGLDTFRTYQTIDRSEHPYICKDAVKFMPVYCSSDTEAGVEYLEELGMIPPREYVTLDFGNNVLRSGFIKYMTYFMDTTSLMRQLTAEVKRLAIPLIVKEVLAFDDLDETIVFNCTGLGAKQLNNDEKMISVRGHLVTLNEKAGTGHMEYMIYSKVKQDGKDEYVYLFPKSMSVTPGNISGTPCRGVLGGTFLPGVDALPLEEQKKFDQIQSKRLLDRNSEFFHGHALCDTTARVKTEL